jgi:hypothetical protein
MDFVACIPLMICENVYVAFRIVFILRPGSGTHRIPLSLDRLAAMRQRRDRVHIHQVMFKI